MKIAILTQPLGKNYGGILQAYALQQILQSLGHEAVIINRVDNYPSFKLLIWRFASFVKCFIAKYLKNDRSIRLISPLSLEYITDTRLVYDYSELNEFIYRNIIRTKEIRSSNKLRRYILRNGYEAIVVGSDQVWREEYSPCITDFFGGFLQNNDRLKLIAYAASFGLDILPISAGESNLCGHLLKRFTAVSVRERSAVNLIKNIWGIESRLVLDPTLLLDKISYERLTNGLITDNYTDIFCYLLDESLEKRQIVQKVSNTRGSNIRKILLYPQNINGSAGKLSSITQWLDAINKSQFVVTDSYHGCVFSIIFKKPFIVIANRKRGIDRFKTLLDLVHLSHRMIYTANELTNDLIEEEVDYSAVGAVIERYKRDSINFLINELTK